MKLPGMVRIGMALGTITLAAAPALAAPSSPAPKVDTATLESGIKLLVIPQPHLPMVVMSALLDAGARYDPVGKEGIASLTADLLTEGTKSRSAEEIHDAIDFLGAQLGASASDDSTSISLTALKKDLTSAGELFAESLRAPTFPTEEFERKRDETLAALEDEDQNPGAVASRAFRRALYGSGAYRTPTSGTAESLKKITVEDVRQFFQSAYRPERTTIVASGDVTLEELRGLVEKLLADWKPTGKPPEGAPAATAQKPTVVRIDRDLAQANIVWGHAGTTRADPDWYAIQVMNYILGAGGFESRLMKSIRTEGGLAYSVHSFFTGPKLPGSFQVVLQTKNASADEALERLDREIEKIRTELVSEEELEEAKLFLTGSFPLRFDSNGEMVAFYSQVEFFGLGLDYPARYPSLINGISREDIRRVAQKYIRPEEAILVIVARQSEIELSER